MPRKALARLHTGDSDLDRAQDETRELFRTVFESAIIDGRLLEDVTLTTGQDNVVGHKLDRTPVGILLAMSSAEATIWHTSKSNKVIVVRTSATVTVNLWVF